MAKRAYVVLALSAAELAYIKQGDPRKALKALQTGKRALFFADFLPAQRFCAIASLPKYEYSKTDNRDDGRCDVSIVRQTNEKGEAIYVIYLPNREVVSMKLGQTLSLADGRTITLEGANVTSTESQIEHNYFLDYVRVVHHLRNGSIKHHVFLYGVTSNINAREYARQFNGPHFNALYEIFSVEVEQCFNHTTKEWWQQGLAYAPDKNMVIVEVETEYAVGDQKPSAWLQTEEPLCIITPRTEPIYDTSKARYFYLDREQENLLNDQRLEARNAYAQKILGISRVCYTNNKAWYWSEVFSPTYHKLDLLRDLVKHLVAGKNDSAMQDVATIKKHVKFSEIHFLFNELAKELADQSERSALAIAHAQLVDAFVKEQANVESRWRLAYWLTAGLAWAFRKLLNLFWTDVPATVPDEATFKIVDVQKGMRDFYQNFRNARHLGYETRAKNVVTHYASPVNFLNYLKEKQGQTRLNVAFNRKGEMSKQITAIDEQAGTVSMRGNNAQIERWELLVSFSKLSPEKQNYWFEWYKARLEKSKLDSQEIVRNHRYRPLM